jgi:hypothetical protein
MFNYRFMFKRYQNEKPPSRANPGKMLREKKLKKSRFGLTIKVYPQRSLL